jgi:hypothetical protein
MMQNLESNMDQYDTRCTDIPEEVRRAAFTVSNYFQMQGIAKWELMDICSRNHADQNRVYESYFQFKKEQEKGHPSCPPGQNSTTQEKEELDNCEQCGDTAWDGRICHSCGAKGHKE